MKKAGKFKVDHHSWTITEMDGNFHRIILHFRIVQERRLKKLLQKVWWLIWEDLHCNQLAIPILSWYPYIIDLCTYFKNRRKTSYSPLWRDLDFYLTLVKWSSFYSQRLLSSFDPWDTIKQHQGLSLLFSVFTMLH